MFEFLIPQAVVGITTDTLYTLLILAAGLPIGFFLFMFFAWFPRASRTIVMAKLFKKDINVDINDMGVISFIKGQAEGAGIFRGGKEIIKIIPRSPEAWMNKTFACDKMKYIFSYSGKAVAVNPATLAITALNQIVSQIKNEPGNEKLTETDAIALFVKNNPEAKNMVENLLKNYTSIPQYTEEEIEDKETGDKKKVRKLGSIQRKVAILLDPRLLKEYISQAIELAQIVYVMKKEYNKGYEDGKTPILGRMLPIILVFGIIAALIVAVMLMFGGNTTTTAKLLFIP
jgi:hypothetical protein